METDLEKLQRVIRLAIGRIENDLSRASDMYKRSYDCGFFEEAEQLDGEVIGIETSLKTLKQMLSGLI